MNNKITYILITLLVLVQVNALQILDSEMLLWGGAFIIYGSKCCILIILSLLLLKCIKHIKQEKAYMVSITVIISQSAILLYSAIWFLSVCRFIDKLERYYDRLHRENIFLTAPPWWIFFFVIILSVFFILHCIKYIQRRKIKENMLN